jgi:hypothetical protein
MADQPPPLPGARPRSLWRETLGEHDGDDRPDGIHIGGWLYLLGANHVLALVTFSFGLLRSIGTFARPEIWLNLTTPGYYLYDPLWSTVITYEIVGSAVGVICCCVSLYLMVGHKRAYRPWVIAYFTGVAAFAWGDFLLLRMIQSFQGQLFVPGLAGALWSALYVIIWVPYILVSKRVKATFVR